MIINKSGILIRIAVSTLRIVGRATQGVKLIDLRDNDSIAAVTKVEADNIGTDDNNVENIEEPKDYLKMMFQRLNRIDFGIIFVSRI